MTDHLYLMQYTCLVLSLTMAIMVVASKFHHDDTTREYERSRWQITASMLLLVIHFVLQIRYGIRANSTMAGTSVNIAFYTPVAFLISLSIMSIEYSAATYRKYLRYGGIGCVSLLLVFFFGWISNGSLDMGNVQIPLHFVFFCAMLFFTLMPGFVLRRNYKRIIDDTGGDIQTFSNFSWLSYIMLCCWAVALVFAIVWTPVLYVVCLPIMLSLLLFISSFIALGFSIKTIRGVIPDSEPVAAAAVESAATAEEVSSLPSDIANAIGESLAKWEADGGFRDNSVNMARLATLLNVDRYVLSVYFESCIRSTFRKWLSDIRFKEAKRLIIQCPEMGNDTISVNCGFSSRSQLYKIFSDKLGMTPREWRESKTAK